MTFDPREDLEISLRTEIEDVHQMTSTSNEDLVNRLITSHTLKKYFSETLSPIMTKMTSQTGQKYNGKESQDFLPLMPNAQFPDRKRPPRLIVGGSFVGELINERHSLKDKKKELQTVLAILDDRRRCRGSHEESN